MYLPLDNPISRMDEANIDESLSYYNLFDTGSRKESPENNLSLAVLIEAISLLLRHGSGNYSRRDYQMTLQWFNGEYECHPGWSFAEIADRLGWDSGKLRNGIYQYVESHGGKSLKGMFIRTTTRALGDEDS